MENKNKRVHLMLDNETIELLNEYSFKKFKRTSVSKAIRALAKEFLNNKNETNKK